MIEEKAASESSANREDVEESAYHTIWVKDNGIGFDEKEAENIFSIFYRLH